MGMGEDLPNFRILEREELKTAQSFYRRTTADFVAMICFPQKARHASHLQQPH